MSITLPPPIASYFVADSSERAAVAACFTETAIVKDEGHTYTGRAEIGRWKAESSAKYSYVSEPFAVEEDGDRIVVTSRVTGTFPGSPVDLRYAFILAGDKIARMEIVV